MEEQMGFIQLLRELAETQLVLMKINGQLAIKEGQEQISEAINATIENFEEQAKHFGANLDKIQADYQAESADRKSIIEEYREQLAEVTGSYDGLLQEILERKGQLEADEQSAMLEEKQNRSELKAARKEFSRNERALRAKIREEIREGQLEEAKESITQLQELLANNPVDSLKAHHEELEARRTELRGMIKECEQKYLEILQERNTTIAELVGEQNNKLAVVSKQNIFQRAIGFLFDKFNGTKKFMKNVIDPLKAKIDLIKEEELPKIQQMIEEKREEFSVSIIEGRAGIEDTVKGKVEEVALKLAQMREDAIQKVTDMRASLVGKAQELGKNAQEAGANFVQGAKDKAETAILYGMEAKDFLQDQVETAILHGMEARDAILARRDAIIKGFKDGKDMIGQGITNAIDAATQAKNVISTHVTDTIDTGKRTYKGIVTKGYQTKMDFLIRAEQRLQEQQAEINRKMQRLNPDIARLDTEVEIGG